MNKYLLYAALLMSSFLFAQEKLEYIDRDEIITLASKSVEEGKKEKALEYLNRINENDSSYCSVLTSKSYYLLGLGKYDEAISTLNQGLSRECSSENVSFYINMSVAFIGSENYSKAVEAIDDALIKYPNHHLLWYNKAVALEGMGKLNAAVSAYQKTIVLNPYYVKPHYN